MPTISILVLPRQVNNSCPAVLTKAEVLPSVCTPLSPSLFTPHQILHSPSLNRRNLSDCSKSITFRSVCFSLILHILCLVHTPSTFASFHFLMHARFSFINRYFGINLASCVTVEIVALLICELTYQCSAQD